MYKKLEEIGKKFKIEGQLYSYQVITNGNINTTYSTVEDLMKFTNCLTNNGTYNGKQIISAQAIKELSYNHVDNILESLIIVSSL